MRVDRGARGAPWKLVDKVVARRAARDPGDEAAKVAHAGAAASARVGLLLLATPSGLGGAGRQAALGRRAEAAVPLCAHQPGRVSGAGGGTRAAARELPPTPRPELPPTHHQQLGHSLEGAAHLPPPWQSDGRARRSLATRGQAHVSGTREGPPTTSCPKARLACLQSLCEHARRRQTGRRPRPPPPPPSPPPPTRGAPRASRQAR